MNQQETHSGLTPEQQRSMNDKYRNKEPSPLHTAAYEAVITGGDIPEETIQEMVERLYEPFPDRKKDIPVDPFKSGLPTKETGNGLGTAVVRNDRSINMHISEKLYRQQPIGVLLRPISDAVRRKGEALITDVTPRTEDVEDDVMPARHVKLTIEPMPVWLAKWVGDNGYPEL